MNLRSGLVVPPIVKPAGDGRKKKKKSKKKVQSEATCDRCLSRISAEDLDIFLEERSFRGPDEFLACHYCSEKYTDDKGFRSHLRDFHMSEIEEAGGVIEGNLYELALVANEDTHCFFACEWCQRLFRPPENERTLCLDCAYQCYDCLCLFPPAESIEFCGILVPSTKPPRATCPTPCSASPLSTTPPQLSSTTTSPSTSSTLPTSAFSVSADAAKGPTTSQPFFQNGPSADEAISLVLNVSSTPNTISSAPTSSITFTSISSTTLSRLSPSAENEKSNSTGKADKCSNAMQGNKLNQALEHQPSRPENGSIFLPPPAKSNSADSNSNYSSTPSPTSTSPIFSKNLKAKRARKISKTPGIMQDNNNFSILRGKRAFSNTSSIIPVPPSTVSPPSSPTPSLLNRNAAYPEKACRGPNVNQDKTFFSTLGMKPAILRSSENIQTKLPSISPPSSPALSSSRFSSYAAAIKWQQQSSLPHYSTTTSTRYSFPAAPTLVIPPDPPIYIEQTHFRGFHQIYTFLFGKKVRLGVLNFYENIFAM